MLLICVSKPERSKRKAIQHIKIYNLKCVNYHTVQGIRSKKSKLSGLYLGDPTNLDHVKVIKFNEKYMYIHYSPSL